MFLPYLVKRSTMVNFIGKSAVSILFKKGLFTIKF